MSQTTGVAEQLERIADALETHTLLLRQIAESNIGQWECLRGSGASDALLKVSMLHYKETPADRYALYLKELEKE